MYKDILFPVDIYEKIPATKEVIDSVVEYAQTFNSRIHVMAVVPDFGSTMVSQYFSANTEEKMMKEASDILHKFVKENFPKEIEIQHIVEQGSIHKCIIDASKEIDADLIIMTAHQPSVEDYMLSPNALKVVRHANCSVLVVRG